MNNDVSMLLDVAKKLDAMDIISISQGCVHCREKFFADNFEPEKVEITGHYLRATKTVGGVDFFSLLNFPHPGDPASMYREAVESLRK